MNLMILASNDKPKRRGPRAQALQRLIEHHVRRSAVATATWMTMRGLTWADAARRLQMKPATLIAWRDGWKDRSRRKPIPRGRPPEHTDKYTRKAVLTVLWALGPGIGIPALCQLFPEVARGELEELQRRYEHAYRKHKRMSIQSLRWTLPRAVWAMDFAVPPKPIERIYEKMLIVRDLASGYQLLALPVTQENGENVKMALLFLFKAYGIPLVIKSDNGSPFICEIVKDVLETHKVLHLLSPPGMPQFNGSCEAGVGSVKVHAHHRSSCLDRPGDWTCDDIEWARCRANAFGHPRGAEEETPEETWRNAPPIPEQMRRELRQTFFRNYWRERREQQISDDALLDEKHDAQIRRVAISRALVEHELVMIRRNGFTPHNKRRRAQNIS